MDLSLASKIEKNRTSNTGESLVTLDILLPTGTLYIVNNNENITWNGQEYIAIPFKYGSANYEANKFPTITLNVTNVTRTVGAALAQVKGGGGTEVILRVVNSKLLNEPALKEEYFIVKDSGRDGTWCSITLGMVDEGQKRFPEKRTMRNFCSYISTTGFKGIECGYNGPETSCDGTLKRCRELGNSPRYGGTAGI
jgi:phage-related protein